MKISARNVFKGIVKSIEVGAVNVEVIVEVAPGIEMTSIITKKSNDHMDLQIGKEAFVIVKASSVILGTNDQPNHKKLLMKKTVDPKDYKIDQSNSNWTKPRTWGTFLISDKTIGANKKRYRFGNYPIRMKELQKEYSSVKLIALFEDKIDAEILADLLENE
jgi:molybdopterin-binding protein